ncbi:type I-E CRISPR-associated protein Cse1/CasA [Thiovibrio sp. JS02]
MNVAFDPWIPVVNANGERELASLCSVLVEGEEYVDLAVRPHERVALMRLFLCVAHAALDGPKDYDEWCEVPKRLPEAARAYLEKWRDAFELFHPTKPWLQVADLKPSKENDEKAFTPVAKLDFALASGAASTLFDHDGTKNAERTFETHQLALGLLSIQNFSTCGLLSRPLWKGVATPDSAKDAPCITSSMYHVFLVGKDLMETLCVNLCDFDELSRLMNDSDHQLWYGKPVWEQMPKSPTESGSTETVLGRLVPISRAIKLFENSSKMLYGEGLRYPIYPDFPREFNTSVVSIKTKKKEERFLVGAKLHIRPWRQLDAILQYNLPSKTLSCALNLGHLDEQAIDIWVGALIRNPGKQDILDSVESRFHISKKFRTERGCTTYSNEVQKAQSVARILDDAVQLYRNELDVSDGKGLGSSVVTHFWTSIENNLGMLMGIVEALDTEEFPTAQDKWRCRLYSAARDAYVVACGQETPRQRRAFAKGWQKLTTTKDEPETDSTESKEVNQ